MAMSELPDGYTYLYDGLVLEYWVSDRAAVTESPLTRTAVIERVRLRKHMPLLVVQVAEGSPDDVLDVLAKLAPSEEALLTRAAEAN